MGNEPFTTINGSTMPDYRAFKRAIIFAVAAVIIMAIAFAVWKSMAEYRLTVRAAELQTKGYARALKEHAERALSEADTVLLDAIDFIQSHGGATSNSGALLRDHLARHPLRSPQIASIVLVNRQGMLYAHSLDIPLKQADVSDRDYFIHHRDGQAGDTPFISRPLQSRINGKWRFTLSRPLRSADGRFDGLVAVAFDMDYFRNFYASLDLGQQGKIVMVRRDGALLLSQPFKETDYSSDFRKSHLIRTYLPRAPKGTFQISGGQALLAPGGRIISYDSLEQFPVVAMANMGIDEVTAQWRENTMIQVTLAVAVSAALALLTLLLLRQIRRIEAAYRRFCVRSGG